MDYVPILHEGCEAPVDPTNVSITSLQTSLGFAGCVLVGSTFKTWTRQEGQKSATVGKSSPTVTFLYMVWEHEEAICPSNDWPDR